MSGGGSYCKHHANISDTSNPNIQEVNNSTPPTTSAPTTAGHTETQTDIYCPNCTPLAPCRHCLVTRQTLLLQGQYWLKNQGTGFRVNQGMTTCYMNQRCGPFQTHRHSTFTEACHPSQNISCQVGPGIQRCCKHRKVPNCMMNGRHLNMNAQQMSAALMLMMNLRDHAANFGWPNQLNRQCQLSSQRSEWSEIFPLQDPRTPGDYTHIDYDTYNSHCDQSINQINQSINGRLPLPYGESDRSNNDYDIFNYDRSNPNDDRFTYNYDECSLNEFVSGQYGHTRQHTYHQQPWGYRVPECGHQHRHCCRNGHHQFDRHGHNY